MTDKPTPTDAELNTILCAHWPAFASQSTLVKICVRDALQDAIDKWGQPAQAEEPANGTAYAALPTSSYAGLVYEEGFLIGTCPLYTADQLHAFADATHTLRASHGQAPASVLHLVNSAFAEIAMAFPKAFALHKVGIADTAVREALTAPAGAGEPTEQQILEAAEKAGLWPNTVHSWIPAFHRYHKELANAQPAPAQAAEPVAYVEVAQSESEVSMTWGPEPAGFSLPNGRYLLYTTPQPTHAQADAREPLTNEHIRAMLNKHQPEDVCAWSYRMGIDDAELHHGIKGG